MKNQVEGNDISKYISIAHSVDSVSGVAINEFLWLSYLHVWLICTYHVTGGFPSDVDGHTPCQRTFQEPRLEVPTINKAYVRAM